MDRSIILKVPVYTAIISMLLLFLVLYMGWLGEPAGVGSHYCEAEKEGMIRQPVNTWSNLGFLVVGLLIAWIQYRGGNRRSNPFNNSIFFSTFYPTMLVLMCPGSMAMHASTTQVGGFIDVFSMLLISTFMVSYALMRVFKWGIKEFVLLYIPILILCVILQLIQFEVPIVNHSGALAYVVFVLLTAIIEHWYYFIQKAKIRYFWGFATISTSLFAFLIWSKSITGSPYCDPSSVVQGHGIWHILGAIAAYWLYKYYTSEDSSVHSV